MIKKIHILTYFIVVFSLLSVGYTGSYFSDVETSIGNTFTAADDWPSNLPCIRSQGYWKNHEWPVGEITIGGVIYTKAEAIDWLDTPVKGDMTIAMFYQLVAAKLNVEIGCESNCITDTIAAADDWMAIYGPVGNGIQEDPPSPWETGEPLKNTLDDYNNGLLCAPRCDGHSPPYEPTNPNPENNAIDVELNPTLSVYVSDPNNDTMDICFYNAADTSLIDNVVNIESNTTVSVVWPNLGYGVTYEWYAVAEDYEGSTQSDTWYFTTIASPPRGGSSSEGGRSGGGSPPSNNPPTAIVGGLYYGNISEPTVFNGSSSFNSDGTIVSYYWNFDDGTNTTETNATTTHQYIDIGTYTVTLTVTDDDGATDSDTTTVTITGLLLKNITATPNPQNPDEYINITCNITNTSQLVDVTLNITYPNGNNTVVSIYQNNIENSTTYYFNQTYNLLGIYEYYIRAYDIENHTTISETYQFSITTDIAPPEISNISVTPEEQEINGYINITAAVTDNIGVKDVFLNITHPDNSVSNITMACINGTVAYYYNSTYPDMGDYKFFIFAIDTGNNTVTSNTAYFSILDMQPPEVFDSTPEIAYKNETFTFNATVTDNNIVADVHVEYWYETGNHTNISMNNTDNVYWEKTIIIPPNFNILQYIIYARDASNNWKHTEIKSITLLE